MLVAKNKSADWIWLFSNSSCSRESRSGGMATNFCATCGRALHMCACLRWASSDHYPRYENSDDPVKHGFILYSNFLMVNIITPGTVVSQITHIQQWYWRMSKITSLKRGGYPRILTKVPEGPKFAR